MRIDVLAWGLRQLRKYQFLNVNDPHVTLECGGFSVSTPKLHNLKKHPNFQVRFRACLLLLEVAPQELVWLLTKLTNVPRMNMWV